MEWPLGASGISRPIQIPKITLLFSQIDACTINSIYAHNVCTVFQAVSKWIIIYQLDKKLCWIMLNPMSATTTPFYLLGDELGITIEKAISGEAMRSLIQEPGGCGEQNMFGITMPVTAANYLDKTNQWHKVGVSRRNDAVNFIKSGKLHPLISTIILNMILKALCNFWASCMEEESTHNNS